MEDGGSSGECGEREPEGGGPSEEGGERAPGGSGVVGCEPAFAEATAGRP
jgi:hypothetical protein